MLKVVIHHDYQILKLLPFVFNLNNIICIYNLIFQIKVRVLDIYEFNNIFNTLSQSDVKIIFNKINIKSKCIQYEEFDDFLCHIDEKIYVEILSCLEAEPIHKDFINDDFINDEKNVSKKIGVINYINY